MNVVGKVGSIITQGVYSVATPFHPFGGAVDVIVVQQQDGTFRSTPWYVRFGKFQGVLKGAEKMVRINVNGVETNFHMYLDNSGEAYFISENVSCKEGLQGADSLNGSPKDSNTHLIITDDSKEDSVKFSRQESRVSDTSDAQLQDGISPSGTDQIEMTESDGERRFFEFQDEQSSIEDSIELSEYGSSRYDNLDNMDQFVEAQDPNAEVVLVSVDGHILTAPISSLERDAENVQLSTPQFHLGPGQGTEFCEDNTGEEDWLADFGASTSNVTSEPNGHRNTNSSAFDHPLEVCENDEKRVHQAKESNHTANQENNPHKHRDLENPSAGFRKKDDIFKSCLELADLAMQIENADCRELPLEIHEEVEESEESIEKSPHSLMEENELSPSYSNSPGSMASSDVKVEYEATQKTTVGTNCMESDGTSVQSVSDDQAAEEHNRIASAVEGVQTSPCEHDHGDGLSKTQITEPQTSPSRESVSGDSRFEISLCGNLLQAGMGLSAAAEAFDAHRISAEEFKLSAALIINNENLVVRIQEKYLPWNKAAPIALGIAAYGLDLPLGPKDAIPVEEDGTPKMSTPSGRRWRLWQIPFRRVKTLEHTSSNSSSEDVFVDSESGVHNQSVEPTTSNSVSEIPHKQFIRTNVPTTEQIESLNLKEGQNMVTFSYATRVLGKQQVEAHIYLWKWNARIVISDVDGTITKSDVLGQFMPLVGKDWTQSGVARLFSAIKENGYQLLFLSARAIVQAYLTRSFLLNIKQDGKTLPSGPIVISPDGLFPSLYREVIRRAPHEFKIACLEDIKALFPADYNPFYAGFGNRDTDELSYRKIGIPKGKIFIINPKGEVAISHRIDVKSYTSLHTLVNDMFPPTSMVEQEDYNSWNYWKVPVLDIDIDD